MLIYLDARDLINIFEKSYPCTADQFDKILLDGGHQLVYSWLNITEISEPLLHTKAKTNVMALLTRLEKTPHTYIHSLSIPRHELGAAAKAYLNGKEYVDIHPFVKRFDYTVDFDANPSTKDYLNYPLAEIIWDIHTFGELSGLDRYAKKLEKSFADDRALSPKPSLKKHFPTKIEKDLKLHCVTAPTGGVIPFANWIYSNPARCPSQRLGYEVWHKMIRNVTDKPEHSDLEDFCHIACLPYVDLLTLDRRMRGYVSQACATLNKYYDSKVCESSNEIVDNLLKQNKK